MPLGNLSTNKSWPDSLRDLQEELRKWDIEDFILPTKRECEQAGRVKVSFAVHGNWVHPECNRWQRSHGADWLERDLRAIVLAIHSARLADQRGIGSLLAEVTRVLALPPANTQHHTALGVSGSATPEEVHHAYREAVKQHHPDVGGDPDKFKELQDAAKALGIT